MKTRLSTLLLSILFMTACSPTTSQIHKMDSKTIFRDSRVAELVTAAETGDVAKVQKLAKDGVNVNSIGRYNVTPLLKTILVKNKDGYLALLKLGANPNALDENGFAAMNIAAGEEDPFWLREALGHGGDPNLENIGNIHFPKQTPLFFAIWKSRVENARMLIMAGANVDHVSQKSGRPLDVAVGHSFEIVHMLLEGGVKYKYNNYDLGRDMNLDLKNHLVGMDAKNKLWFYKCMDFLESKGAKFDRPEKK